jgi:hypothetical protein
MQTLHIFCRGRKYICYYCNCNTVLSFLLSSSAVKEGHDTGDSSKLIPGHDQQGMLKTMLKRTSLRHWMRKESNTIGHGSSDGNDHTVCKEHSVDVARFVT